MEKTKQQFLATSRAHLGELGKLTDETAAAERGILERATARLEQVDAMIERQRPGIEAAPDASQDRYLALVTERGQLHTVIGKARQALGI